MQTRAANSVHLGHTVEQLYNSREAICKGGKFLRTADAFYNIIIAQYRTHIVVVQGAKLPGE